MCVTAFTIRWAWLDSKNISGYFNVLKADKLVRGSIIYMRSENLMWQCACLIVFLHKGTCKRINV